MVGSVFAIAVVKEAFGGLGSNFVNPALAARAVLLAAWPVHMTSYAVPFVDGATHATPLSILSGAAQGELPSYLDLFLGNVGGVIGETSALALLVGGISLLVKGVIDWRTPVGFLGTVFVLSGSSAEMPVFSPGIPSSPAGRWLDAAPSSWPPTMSLHR